MITKVKRLHPDAVLPRYGYPGDAGMDLAVVGEHTLAPGESRDLPTGIAVEMPEDLWGRITGRSSTLRRRGLFVNEGVIDNGYRGELLIYVTNRQSTPVTVESGDRLAQLILTSIWQAPGEWADELTPSERGTNGFGSTGHRTIEIPRRSPGQPGLDDHEALGLDIDQLQQDGAQEPPNLARLARAAGILPSTKPTLVNRVPVYLGGAVDQSTATHGRDDWRHHRMWEEEGVWTYCPKCELDGVSDPAEIIKRNMAALRAAPIAVLDLTEKSIGTPIEAWLRCEELRLPAILIYGTGYADEPRSVFVDYLERHPFVSRITGWSGLAGLVVASMRRGITKNT